MLSVMIKMWLRLTNENGFNDIFTTSPVELVLEVKILVIGTQILPAENGS